MKTPVQFLPEEYFRVLKVIRVNGPEWNRFTGYISYKRILTRDYQAKSPDYVDELIFETIKHIYHDAQLYINNDIYFEGELEDLSKIFRGGTKIDFTIRFTPTIPYERIAEMIGRTLNEYFRIFNFNLFLNTDSEKIQLINNFTISYIPFDKLENFQEKIKSFDFI